MSKTKLDNSQCINFEFLLFYLLLRKFNYFKSTFKIGLKNMSSHKICKIILILFKVPINKVF